MISSRYAKSFIVLASLALAPTLIHSYVGLRHQDGLSTKAISQSFGTLRSEKTGRKEQWVEKNFQSDDWIERNYDHGLSDRNHGEPLLLFVGRSYDPKRLYHHPELGLLKRKDLEESPTVRLPDHPERPIHVLKGPHSRGKRGLVVYAILSEQEFIDNPILFQLKNAVRFLFQARKPMTLFFVYDARESMEGSLGDSSALELLDKAIEDFLSQNPGT